MSVIPYVLLRFFVRGKEAIRAQLDREHALQADEQASSERLKRGETTIADGHGDVTVMFADIVDFTRRTDQIPPLEMIALLNKVFSSFDQLAETRRLENIKTIGDCERVAGGLADRDGTAESVADAALAMPELFHRDPEFRRHDMSLHVGIPSGPVVAGMIGVKRFVGPRGATR